MYVEPGACADNCMSCTTAGHGMCDEGQCNTGYIRLADGSGCVGKHLLNSQLPVHTQLLRGRLKLCYIE